MPKNMLLPQKVLDLWMVSHVGHLTLRDSFGETTGVCNHFILEGQRLPNHGCLTFIYWGILHRFLDYFHRGQLPRG